jgi:hypothetical protein
MRTLRTFLLVTAMTGSVLLLIAYARNVSWMFDVRPWGGVQNFVGWKVMVYHPRIDGPSGLQLLRVQPFFPSGNDFDKDYSVVASFPTLFAVLPSLGLLAWGALTFTKKGTR